MKQQAEGLITLPPLQPGQGEIGGQVGGVAFQSLALPHFDKIGIVIAPLAGKNIPIIETGRLAFQMPFTHQSGLIAGLLQQLREGLLRAVEHHRVVDLPVTMAVLPGQQHRPAGSTDRIGAETTLEAHPPRRQPVDVGGAVNHAAIGADGLVAVIVGHDENDVGAGIRTLAGARQDQQKQHDSADWEKL